MLRGWVVLVTRRMPLCSITLLRFLLHYINQAEIKFHHSDSFQELVGPLFKIIDGMAEYPLFVRLEMQEYLANNKKIAGMLKGRPLEAIKEYAHQRWLIYAYLSISDLIYF